jgi:hypothetical protein
MRLASEQEWEVALKPRVQIENWAFTKYQGWQFTTEQGFGSFLAGRAAQHPKLGDANVLTSSVIDVTENRETLEVETSNTVYILGAMSAEYAEFLAASTAQA